MDIKKIEEHVRGILEAMGADIDSEGLRETPLRVAKMYEEVFEGMKYSNDDLARMYGKTFEENIKSDNSENDMVLMKDIEIFSHCEHHLALMYNMKVSVAYIPKIKIIGLSKIARIADMVGRRLQLQERIGEDIADIIMKITESEDVAVIIEGEHGCMTVRGIKKPGTKTMTTTLKGRFNRDPILNNRLFRMI
ncbi:MAG: GTP cyclohydrolase I FolE [Anaeromicrobium sp.]|jgi:GTP cyclohydrolase I|uniref:GTP cyclohydrolase I FolE n=1 Tax=Anaeromicrobium sp. TaxID=1929132 RepID=UPI0025E9C9B1|nr:GTP cyclohydrolase I FolE [Anaeromicrobium sp.]MCT4595299.1 GTP cyclohydrolase I FolE [Anaeromicrobium sp.]